MLIQNFRMSFFIYNGKFFTEGTPVINIDNHSFRYGNGLFETIKSEYGKLLLHDFHFERLFFGLKILQFDVPQNFTVSFFENEILRLLKKNDHTKTARIRLMIFKGDGTLDNPQDHFPNYIIQTWHLPDSNSLNTSGLVIDVYHYAKKCCDTLSNIKTNNFLPYALAAHYAKKNNLNDCILVNTYERICDCTIANIFIIKNKKIYTPSLSEGCIAGVMRRWIIEKIKTEATLVIEKPLCIEDIKSADEIFLTNSIYPIRWVSQFQNVHYTNKQIQLLYSDLNKTF